MKNEKKERKTARQKAVAGSPSFTKFMLTVIDELRLEERFGTVHVYTFAFRALTHFAGGGEILFDALSRQMLKRFENHLRDRQCSWNTVSTYVRALRAVYNRAVDSGIIPGEYRLFSALYTSSESERKRALSAEQMRVLMLAGTNTPNLPEDVRQSGMLLSLMLYLHGMPFADLIHLHRDDLYTDSSGRTTLKCHRQKTGTVLKVTVTDEALELIRHFRSTNPDSPYLLNLLDGRYKGEAAYREYCHHLRNLNHNLSKLSVSCRLEGVRVSSYTARHTWATLAKFCQVPEEVISEGLGHSSLEVTRTYLKSFEDGESDEAGRLIINYIFTGVKAVWNRA